MLLARYRTSLDCIYIDPPYNTGNDGFPYKDSYQHSSWVTLMASRLSLAQHLMRPDSVFFVSLDDIEAHRFRCLCDTMAPQLELISQLVWKSRQHLDSLSQDSCVE